jgi:hypothetical protein
VTTVAGIPGLPGFQDGSTAEVTFNRPTWLDIVAVNDPEACPTAVGDIWVVDRANQDLRIISGNHVSSYSRRAAQDPASSYPFDFGGPYGGGIVIEPPFAGCGGGQYASGLFVAASGRHEVPLMSSCGTLAFRDAFVIIGRTNEGSIDYSKFPALRTPTGLALSRTSSRRALYIADTGGHTIRRVLWGLSFEGCPNPSTVDTLAGRPDVTGSADGIGDAARFNAPLGLATAPDGSLYVADSGNHTIRRIDLQGTVTTVAGEAGVAGKNDGPARQAHLNAPAGIDFDSNGNLFIADSGNATIRMLTAEGLLITIAGTPGVSGYADGPGSRAQFSGPVGLRVAPDGTIVVADTSNNAIRRLTLVSRKDRERAAQH